LNFIISTKLNTKQFTIQPFSVGQDSIDYIFRKKHESRDTFEFPKISQGHLPFYDPFLSINYDKSTIKKRRDFTTKNANLPSSNSVRKANNKNIIDTYLETTDKISLLGDNLNRNHILNAILNAISFKNNTNIVKQLCIYLILNKPELVFKKFKEQHKTVIDYLVDSDEYFVYGMLLYLYQLILEEPVDLRDKQTVLSYLTKHIIKLPKLQELVDIMIENKQPHNTYTNIINKFARRVIIYIDLCDYTEEKTNLIANLMNFMCTIITSMPEIDKSYLESVGLVVNDKLITAEDEIHSFLKTNYLNDINRNILTKITFCMSTRPSSSRKTKKLGKYRMTKSENFTSLRKKQSYYFNNSM